MSWLKNVVRRWLGIEQRKVINLRPLLEGSGSRLTQEQIAALQTWWVASAMRRNQPR